MKKSFRRYYSLFVFLFCLSLFASTALASGWAADVILTDKNGVTNAKMYIAYGIPAMRYESMDRKDFIFIGRMDKMVMWMLTPSQKTYMEIPMKQDTASMMTGTASEKMTGEVERVPLGQELIDGRMTTKYRVTTVYNNNRYSNYMWLLDDGGFPVKTAAIDGSWTNEYKNLVFGDPDSSYFVEPDGYKKIVIPNLPFGLGR